MARRTGNSTPAQSSDQAVDSTNTEQENEMTTVTDTTEATEVAESTDTTDQAPGETVAVAESEAQASAEAEAKAQADMEAFEKSVAEAIEARDTSTGVVPEAQISAVNATYRELDGAKAKANAKKLVGEGMKTALNAMDLTTARAYMNLQEKLSAAGGGTKAAAEKPPADPTEALAQQFAVLQLANANVSIAETIDRAKLQELIDKLVSEAGDKVSAYITYLSTETPEGEDEPEEPNVEGYVKNAAKLALGRSAKAGAAKAKASGGGTSSGTSYSGPRRDVAKHIQSAFANLETGKFLTIAQIADHKSDEYTAADGTFDKPSQGAISARLFPSGEGKKCTVEGVEPTTADGKKGARKA